MRKRIQNATKNKIKKKLILTWKQQKQKQIQKIYIHNLI